MNAPPKITSMTSRQFNQDTARAKRAALAGPVYITSRGEPTHVLISKAEFDRLEASAERPKRRSIVDVIAQKEGGDFDFDFPEFKDSFSLRPMDFGDLD